MLRSLAIVLQCVLQQCTSGRHRCIIPIDRVNNRLVNDCLFGMKYDPKAVNTPQ